ncbi:MAG: hypothetical protein M3O86_00925 [Actinomycetota bacterium]|nr:hypothetical protein [Actinomycetota bacterium]
MDHYLEILAHKPGALPGWLALVQAREQGLFTATHQRFWDHARAQHGAEGTRRICEVLPLHRRVPVEQVTAGRIATLNVDSSEPNLVGIEARRPAALPRLDGYALLKASR